MLRRLLRGLGVAVAVCVVALGVIATIPVDTAGLVDARPRPLATVDAARAEVSRIVASEKGVSADCHSRLIAPAEPVQRVIVLLHGLGSCPRQFAGLAAELAGRGFAVYVPLLPHHGLSRGDAGSLAGLTAGDLRIAADHAIDVARGLGGRVWVLGISTGGVMAAWAGQARADVEGAIVISPLLGLANMPDVVSTGVANLFSRVPALALPIAGPSEGGYDGLSTRAIAETLRLGAAVRESADAVPPAAKVLAVVFNEDDSSVSNGLAADLADAWQRHGSPVERVSLPGALRLPDDVIDAANPRANPAVVFPAIIELLPGQS